MPKPKKALTQEKVVVDSSRLEELVESEQKYRDLFESSVDGIVSIDIKGRITLCNKAFAEMLGYKIDELKKRTYDQITPKKWRRTSALVMKQVRSRGYSDYYEKEYMRKDGSTVPVSVKMWVVRNEKGKPAGFWKIVRDITEVKKSEEALRLSEERFRSFFENAGAVVIILDKAGKILLANDMVEKMSGVLKSKVVGRMFTDFLIPEEREKVRRYHEARGELQRAPREYTTIGVNVKGEKRNLEVTASIIPGTTDTIALVRDVTEKKKAEHELIRLKEFNESVVDGAPIPMLVFDKNLVIHSLNPAFERWSRVKREDAIGTPMLKHFGHLRKYGLDRMLQKVLKTHKPLDIPELMIESPRLGRYWINLRMSPIEDGVIASVVEITERKKAEEEILGLKEFNEQIVQRSPIPMVVVDKDHFIRVWNPAMERLSKIKAKDIVGRFAYERFGYIGKYGLTAIAKQVLRLGRPFSVPDLRIEDPRLGEYWVSIRISPMKAGGVVVSVIDISERRRVEEAIRESESKYRAIVDASPDCIMTISPDGRFLSVNKEFERVTGYRAEEVIGKYFKMLLTPRSAIDVFKAFARFLATRVPVSIDFEARMKSGELRLFNANSSMIREGNKLKSILVISRDITEKRKSEEALRLSEEKYHALIEESPDPIITIAPNGKFLSVNRIFTEVLGYSEEEVLGKPVTMILTPRSGIETMTALANFIRTGVLKSIDLEVRTKSGELRLFNERASLIREGGKLKAVMVIGRDVTKKRKAEEAIRASEAKYRALVEKSPDPIITTSLDGRFLSVNKAFKDLSGYSEEEVIGKPVTMLLTPKSIPLVAKRFMPFISHQLKTPVDFEARSKSGEVRIMSGDGNAIYEGNKPVALLIVARDITGRIKMEEEPKKRLEEVEKLNKFMLGREKRIIELKKRIRELEEKGKW